MEKKKTGKNDKQCISRKSGNLLFKNVIFGISLLGLDLYHSSILHIQREKELIEVPVQINFE